MTNRRPFALRSLRFAALLFALTALPFAAHAQTATATLSGTVEDEKGAVVPGVTVAVLNVDTSFRRESMTNESGSFLFTLLPPGRYSLTAERQGFKVMQVPSIVLNVGDQKALQIKLEAGSISETVRIEGEAPLINESAAVATTIDRQFVGSLPLNGRSFQSLILLTPGVTVSSASAASDQGQFSVNGQRASSNYFTVDGVSANIGISIGTENVTPGALAGSYPGLSAFGSTTNLVSIDALEEFKIQTSTYTAELGRQPGGQVQLITRSGTNDFRGSLFEYFRNDVLDARDYFNKKLAPKPALRQNDFGGTFGGPIFKNKTFFFFSYEGQRLRLPISGNASVPSLRVRAAAAAAVKPLLNAFPQPTGPEIVTSTPCPVPADPRCDPTTNRLFSGWAPFAYGISNPSTMDATSIRIDHTFSSRLTLFGRFNESPSNATTFNGGAIGTVSNVSTRTLTVGVTSAFASRLSNEFRVNYSRQLGQRQSVPATYAGAVPVDTALLTNGYEGEGTVFFGFGGIFSSLARGDSTKNFQRQLNIVDNVSLVKGKHGFKFGIDYRRLSPTFGVQQSQRVSFNSEAGLNTATAQSVSIRNFDSAHPRFTSFSAYGQDTWKVTPRLTIDLGLRWELNPAPTEVKGKIPAMALGISGNPPDVSQATLAPLGTPFYKTFYTAFAPRFSVAYQLNTSSGYETVLRGGFGVYYDLGSAGATSGYPLFASTVLSNVPFPLFAAAATRPPITIPTSLPVTTLVYSSARDLQLPYTLQWNVALERSLGARQSLSLSYVAAAARRLLTRQSINRPVGNTSGPRPNSNFGTIIYTWNGSTSDYHSLQAQYKARLTNGLQALVNYTWSHAIDEVSNDLGSGVLSRGNADFDVRHNLSAAITYKAAKLKIAKPLEWIINGWSLDAIVHAQTGRPLDVTGDNTVVDGIQVLLRPDLVPGQPLYINDPAVPGGRRFNSAAFQNPPFDPAFPTTLSKQGNFGRNVLRELPLYQIDLAVRRNFKFTERFNLQLKGEFFNILNHPMFGFYGTSFRTPSTFGVPTTTLSRALGGLGSLYQMGGPRSVQLSLRLGF